MLRHARTTSFVWQASSLALAVAVAVFAACNNQKASFTGNSLDALAPKIVTDQTFPAATVASSDTHFQPAFGIVTDQLTLVENAPLTKTLTQTSRAVANDAFQQGNNGGLYIADLKVSQFSKLDMIVIVDNSSSMAQEQTTLAVGMQSFISNFANVDWQVGVLTTDNGPAPDQSGCTLYGTDGYPGGTPILASDPLANSKFVSTITSLALPNRHHAPSDSEESLRNLYQHLTGTCAYPSAAWLRPDALLTVLVLTDEDSFCPEPTGTAKDSDSLMCGLGEKPSDIIGLLTPPMRVANKARFYSLTWHTTDVACNSGAQRPANRILATVAGVGGFDDSLCSSDYSSTFQKMSLDAAATVQHQFVLPYAPSGSIQLAIDGTPLAPADYAFNGKVLTLNNVNPTQSVLHISFNHDPVAIVSSFPLSLKPDTSSLAVSVNNIVQDPGTYTYDAASGLLTFFSAPPEYATITAKYRAAGVLPSSFDLSSLALSAAPISVTVNGQDVTNFAWDQGKQQLSFATPPADGTAIVVTYPPKIGKVTHYALSTLPSGATPLSVTVTDATTGADIEVTEDAGDLVFAEADVVNGRSVNVRYDYGDSTTVLKHTLANTPLAATLKVKVDANSPQCLNQITVVGTELEFHCDASKLGSVEVSYQYIAASYTTFTIDQDIPAGAYTQVFVDGVAVTGYTVSGRTFTLPPASLHWNSIVHILVASETP